MRAYVYRMPVRDMPWVVKFTPCIGAWDWHCFYRWDDALRFATEILGPNQEARDHWLCQLGVMAS